MPRNKKPKSEQSYKMGLGFRIKVEVITMVS